MTVELTIIGLGRIGASIGMALAGETSQMHRTGHDRQADISNKALKMGAVDQVQSNLHAAVAKADLVVLAIPLDEVHNTLEEIAADLRPGAVVLGTSPVQSAVSKWATSLLPAKCPFVSFTPTINPGYLEEKETGLEAAHADLFKDQVVFISAPPATNPDALKLASDLTSLIGARPLFSDLFESDGLLAATALLPMLVSAALVNATTGQPGWQEGRKLAGPAYTQATLPTLKLDGLKTFGQSAIHNKENAIRVLDNMIDALQQVRAAISEDDSEQLSSLLDHARQERIQWWEERHAGKWDLPRSSQAELPSKRGLFSGMFWPGKPRKEPK